MPDISAVVANFGGQYTKIGYAGAEAPNFLAPTVGAAAFPPFTVCPRYPLLSLPLCLVAPLSCLVIIAKVCVCGCGGLLLLLTALLP